MASRKGGGSYIAKVPYAEASRLSENIQGCLVLRCYYLDEVAHIAFLCRWFAHVSIQMMPLLRTQS